MYLGETPTATEIVRLMKVASRKAAEAREANDVEGYTFWREILNALSRINSGAGTTEDLLMIERAKKQEWQLRAVRGFALVPAALGIAALALLLR